MVPLELAWDWPSTPLLLAAVLVSGLIGHLVLRRAITLTTRRMVARARDREQRSSPDPTSQARLHQRTATIGSMLRSITAFVVWTVVVLTMLSIIGVPLAPLLASAGVGGVALAFGAQSLVKDFLSGVFMLMEDQFGVGDLVEIGDTSGTVEEVSLRVTRLRDASGLVWYIRNGEIMRVGNISQGWSTAMIDIPIAAGQDSQAAIDVLTKTAAEFADDEQWASVLLDPPLVLGVESVTGTQYVLRIRVKAAPNKAGGPSRALREAAVVALESAGFRLAPTTP
jgi:small conductance mechanosensitive channel